MSERSDFYFSRKWWRWPFNARMEKEGEIRKWRYAGYVSFRTYAVDEIGIKTVPLENKTFSIRCNYL